MNRIIEKLLLPIVLQVTQVPLGSYGMMNGQPDDYMLTRNFSGSIKIKKKTIPGPSIQFGGSGSLPSAGGILVYVGNFPLFFYDQISN
jgi:hypothetical protein